MAPAFAAGTPESTPKSSSVSARTPSGFSKSPKNRGSVASKVSSICRIAFFLIASARVSMLMKFDCPSERKAITRFRASSPLMFPVERCSAR